MAVTLHQLADYAEHAVGSQFDGRLDVYDIVNQAGHHLTTLHPWTWLQRSVQRLDFVADQPFVNLPADFARLENVEATDSITRDVYITTLDTVERHRQDLVVSVWDYFVALEWPPQDNKEAPAEGPRLAIWPTPVSDTRNALRLIYEAGWRRLTAADEVANVPAWIEPLLIEVVRTFARGYIDDQRGQASLTQRLESLANSQFLRDFKERDGGQQPVLGYLSGGAVDTAASTVYRPFHTIER